jgi:hypothetical protein
LNYPSPDKYNIRKEDSWKAKVPVTIKSRTKFFYDEDLKKFEHCISPQKYLPDTKIVENLRFRNLSISFGKGNRSPNANPCKNN